MNVGFLDIAFVFVGLVFGIALALLTQHLGRLRAVGRNTLPIYVMHTTVLVALIVVLSVSAIDLNALPGAAYWAPIALALPATTAWRGIGACCRQAGHL